MEHKTGRKANLKSYNFVEEQATKQIETIAKTQDSHFNANFLLPEQKAEKVYVQKQEKVKPEDMIKCKQELKLALNDVEHIPTPTNGICKAPIISPYAVRVVPSPCNYNYNPKHNNN